MNTAERINASLIASSVGDAMGAGVFKMSREQIAEHWPSGLFEFLTPPDDSLLAELAPGGVTDGTSQLILLSRVIDQHGLVGVRAHYGAALKEWMRLSQLAKFSGPTTRFAIESGPPAKSDNVDASNGAAMRIAPVGWSTSGNVDAAITVAAEVAGLTHTAQEWSGRA